jgi:hypothetical protein
MAYADIGDAVSGAVITETWGDQVRANFQAGVPDIFTTKGDIAAATAADTAARLGVGADDATLVADASAATGLAWQIQPACHVYNDANIDPTPATWVTLTFNSERFDTDAMHSVLANTSRLTVPTGGGGLYIIGANVRFATGIDANADSPCGVRLLLNGATVIGETFVVSYRATTYDLHLQVDALYALVATDYVEVQAFTEQNIDVVAAAAYSPEFWAIWQRRA